MSQAQSTSQQVLHANVAYPINCGRLSFDHDLLPESPPEMGHMLPDFNQESSRPNAYAE